MPANTSQQGGNGGGSGPLGELIARAESGTSGYNAFNRGVAGDSHGTQIDFAQKTIAEIMQAQSLPKGDAARFFAVGRYYYIPATLKDAVAKLELDPAAKFTPAVQERIFRNYVLAIKRPQVKNYITGQSDDLAAAQLALSREFASIADPATGNPHFGGAGGNKAAISAEQTAKALQQEREQYRQSIANGKGPTAAWDALSPGLA